VFLVHIQHPSMTFLEKVFNSMGTNDLKRNCCDSLELVLLSLLVELYG
jgi:hypothetical protein